MTSKKPSRIPGTVFFIKTPFLNPGDAKPDPWKTEQYPCESKVQPCCKIHTPII